MSSAACPGGFLRHLGHQARNGEESIARGGSITRANSQYFAVARAAAASKEMKRKLLLAMRHPRHASY